MWKVEGKRFKKDYSTDGLFSLRYNCRALRPSKKTASEFTEKIQGTNLCSDIKICATLSQVTL